MTTRILVFLFDLFAVLVAWTGGLLVRFNFAWPSDYDLEIVQVLAILLPIHTLACHWSGLYRGIWRFASLPDLKRVLRAVTASTIGLLAIKAIGLHSGPALPRAMLVLYPLLLATTMCGGRVAWRMWKEYRLYGGLATTGRPVVVVGAGNGGAMLVHALAHSADWRVVALVDDDKKKWGLELSGVPVAGGVSSLSKVLADYQAAHVILAMASASQTVIGRAVNIAVASGAQAFMIPGIEELMSGRVTIDAMRPVNVEDLLGRDPVNIDTTHVHDLIAHRTILITGAGGSIGSELCRQLARFEPERLLLLETGEYALYSIAEWFAHYHPEIKVVPLIGDIKDTHRNEAIFANWQPQIVFHAAAYKHVPLMETHNAWQAIRNNVLGTLQLARCARQHGVERFVMISTDKAVNPTNVMGASKRMAEMICQALAVQNGTRFEVVRFGNVLGSTGSVIPKFQRQIARGGPVTVTHPEITRYFMSIPEAAQLVLQAVTQGQGGEIFVLDMGEPVKIADLARNMIRLSGYSDTQIRIEFTGLRPGEKLYEELLADAERTRPTPHPKLRIALARPVAVDFLDALQTWLHQPGPVSDESVRRDIARWVRDYKPAQHDTPKVITPTPGASSM
jgi:FlaA1/EpsC-like NDP-sugar epimerase